MRVEGVDLKPMRLELQDGTAVLVAEMLQLRSASPNQGRGLDLSFAKDANPGYSKTLHLPRTSENEGLVTLTP